MTLSDQHANLRASFTTGATRAIDARAAQLQKLATALLAQESTLLAALRADLGKPESEAYASELGFLQGDIRYALRHLRRWAAPKRRGLPPALWPGCGRIVPEPRGVVLIIGPWNYPLQLTLSPLVSALAAGNCAMLKPSELAPHTAECIDALVRETFDPGIVEVVQGGAQETQELLALPFDHIFFTGSTRVGRLVMEAAARHPTPVTLELGGKCPCIVCEDTHITTAARRIVWGKFLNAGQTCVAPDTVFVDRRCRDELVKAMQQAIREFYGDDPLQSPDYGRIVNRRHFDRLRAYLEAGDTVVGGRVDETTLSIEPTVLLDPGPESAVMQEEIFGPILPVIAFDDLGTVITQLRAQPTPLALYLFSESRSIRRRIIGQVHSGGVCINDVVSHIVGRRFPFGGQGASGVGAYHGKTGFDTFSHYRTIVRRALRPDPPQRYPPSRISLRALRRIQRWLLDG